MSARRVGWVDATSGISGDMLLGACVGAGVELAVVQEAIDRLQLPEPIVLKAERTRRGALGATRIVVHVSRSIRHRTLADVLELLGRADTEVRNRAAAVFRALAEAEARVHDMSVEGVHFHEVGALDSIADVVGVVAAIDALKLDRLVCSPIALGGGHIQTEHGRLPLPGPAVLELLRAHNAPGSGGPVALELATPTGVALMAVLADEFGSLPVVRPERIGLGAGSKDPADHTNVTRLVVGRYAHAGADAVGPVESAVVLEANVDDLDPRLWPQVLADLLAAGASDAWLTPILMKKGRPAHTLSVLAEPPHVETLQRLVLTHTSTIGLRVSSVDKVALPREWVVVNVYGEQVRVKIARLDGEIVNAVPEYDDVARVAAEHGVAAKRVITAAQAAAERITSS